MQMPVGGSIVGDMRIVVLLIMCMFVFELMDGGIRNMR